MDELTLAIVGIDYPNADKSKSNRRMELLLCVPGEPVELRLEPKNPHDENAVAVFSARGVQVGYLTADRAPWIAKRIQSEDFAITFQALHGGAAYARIRFGGGEPTLPPPVPAPAIPAQPRPMRRTVHAARGRCGQGDRVRFLVDYRRGTSRGIAPDTDTENGGKLPFLVCLGTGSLSANFPFQYIPISTFVADFRRFLRYGSSRLIPICSSQAPGIVGTIRGIGLGVGVSC